ncbi:MAG: enoyl-CoA hydratase/isomerase family protein [Candidatus Dormibacteraceae bacterium]
MAESPSRNPPPGGASVLTSRVENEVGWIHLNRPQQRNALNGDLRRGLIAALKQAVRDPAVRAIVLIGDGRSFCAGADIGEFDRFDEEGLAPLAADYGVMLTTLRGASKPTIAAIRGAAAGIGVSLALCCDLRIATPDAFFREAFVDLGLTVDGGATWLLPRIVGSARALELCYTGRRLGSQEAERWGLVNQVVAEDRLEAAARELAEKLARGPRQALAAIKRSVAYGESATFEESVDFEFLLQGTLVGAPDFREGVAAFLAKRSPRFHGGDG